MKTRFLTSVFILLMTGLITESVLAQDRPGNREFGIILGEPTGLSAKYWTTTNTAMDFALAWSFGREGSIHFHSNYLFHRQIERPTLAWFYGIGGRVLLQDDPKVSARFPVGLQYIIPDTRLGIFFELAPMLDLIPGTGFSLNGGAGVRYFL